MRKLDKKINKLINKIEIVLGRETLLSYPRGVQIEPTNRCNQRCVMCPRTAGLDVPIGDMSLESFKKIIDKLPTIRKLFLSGLGEPMLNPDLPEMIAFASSRGIIVSINSNGAVIDETLAKKLVNSGLRLIKISIDSADPKVYQSIRGGSIDPVIRGIRNLVEARKEKGAAFPGITINSIIMKQNYKELIDILRLGESLEINLVRFKPVNIFDLYEDKDLIVDQNELKEAIQEAIELSRGMNIRHNLDQILKDFDTYYRPKEKTPCYSPWIELYIQYYGGVKICCQFYGKKYDIGNILEEDFKQIWNSAKMQKIRKEFKKGNTYFPVCKNCNSFQKNILVHQKINKLKHFYKK